VRAGLRACWGPAPGKGFGYMHLSLLDDVCLKLYRAYLRMFTGTNPRKMKSGRKPPGTAFRLHQCRQVNACAPGATPLKGVATRGGAVVTSNTYVPLEPMSATIDSVLPSSADVEGVIAGGRSRTGVRSCTCSQCERRGGQLNHLEATLVVQQTGRHV
jgi:hypothetical protein